MARRYRVIYSDGRHHVPVTTTANTRRAAERYGRHGLVEEVGKPRARAYAPISVVFVGKQ